MKILIIGGLHGNEPLGINLVKQVQEIRNPNLQAIFGNPKAIEQNVRFVQQDLNRVFDLEGQESL
jgi:aspartoacylase